MQTDELKTISNQIKTGLTEFLEQADFKKHELFVLGCSTSEIQGKKIGKYSNLDVGRTVIETVTSVLEPLQIDLAVQGCEHLNRALAMEREVAENHGFEIVSVCPSLHAGGATQVAAFEHFNDPVEVEHVIAKGGMDIGDTAIGMHVKFVQIPVRTSIKEVGDAHITYLSSRPKLIGGERAIYRFENLNQQVDPLNPLA